MENFHIDILENILFRLPFTATLQASQVCKTWKTLLSNRCCNEVGYLVSYNLSEDCGVQLYYAEQYDDIHDDVDHRTKMMNYYYGRFNRIFRWDDLVVGSFNGLVCLRKRDKHYEVQYIICNPLTGEYVFVPQFDYPSLEDRHKDGELVRRKPWSRHERVSDGFGYCHSTNEYKVVRIYYNKGRVGNILVYTIGSHQWRNVGIMDHNLCSSRGVYANGVLHWLNSEIQEHKVFGFDLKHEKFQRLPMLPCVPMVDRKLKLLGGNLSFVGKDHCACVEVWAYKRNNNNMDEHNQTYGYYDHNSWNWIKEFCIDSGNGSCFEPFAFTRRNQVLLWHKGNNLYSYDPKASSAVNEQWDNITDNGMCLLYIEAIPHTNSFLSLKDLGESGAKSCKEATNQYTKQVKRKRYSMTSVNFE